MKPYRRILPVHLVGIIIITAAAASAFNPLQWFSGAQPTPTVAAPSTAPLAAVPRAAAAAPESFAPIAQAAQRAAHATDRQIIVAGEKYRALASGVSRRDARAERYCGTVHDYSHSGAGSNSSVVPHHAGTSTRHGRSLIKSVLI